MILIGRHGGRHRGGLLALVMMGFFFANLCLTASLMKRGIPYI